MQDQLKKRKRKANLNRLLAFVVAFIMLSLILLSVVFTREIITVTDSSGHAYNVLTAKANAGLAAKIAQVSGVYDQLDFNSENAAARQYSYVWADGLLHRVDLKSGTVGDLLAECGVEVTGEDYVEPAADTPIDGQMRVEVCRVAYKEEYVRTEVDSKNVEDYKAKYYAENPTGNFKESNGGVYDVIFRYKMVNGDISESEILELCPVMTPRPEGSTEFIAGVPCSRIEGFDDIKMGPDGLPVGYTRKISSNTTAYSSSGGRGASRLGLYNGTAAVNPNVIPYGTRMYITSSDGSFVYGWTIATDTGTALMDGRATVDLYFETNGECLRFGRRTLDVYIFD